jgi:hypothetical protein
MIEDELIKGVVGLPLVIVELVTGTDVAERALVRSDI